MHLNPIELKEGVTFGFAGLQGGAFGTAGLANACAFLGFCFGPQRAGIGLEEMLQALCTMFGFYFSPQTARMAAQEQPLDTPPWQDLAILPIMVPMFSASFSIFLSSSIGSGMCVSVVASFPERLLDLSMLLRT